jgi:hypothetical protein
MRDSRIRGKEYREEFVAELRSHLSGGEAWADALAKKGKPIHVAPTGGDDTERLQAALDEAATAGPGAVIELTAGTFRVGRPLIGLNFDGTIRGAGSQKTRVLADGSINADGLFQLLPADEAVALRFFRFPVMFAFLEGDVDRFGAPVTNRRSQRLVMRDLTLGASGQTVAHFDISAEADTQRLFSLVWVAGFRPDWTNSQNQTPVDIGGIDAEHAQVSTVRATFRSVGFDGRNRARAENEPGGPFDPNPDVRNAFGVEGGIALVQPPPNPVFFFRPINAALRFEGCKFTDLPGQAGVFAPQLVGRNDPAWTFGPDAVEGGVRVTNSVFENTPDGLLLPDISDVRVSVDHSSGRRSAEFGLLVTNIQANSAAAIGYPASVTSRATISNSTFEDMDFAVVVNETVGPSLVDLRVRDNNFILEGPSQIGVVGLTVDDARIADNDFSGVGFAGVVALTSAHWRIRNNDFCDLFIPPSPQNPAQAPVVTANSDDIKLTDNACA